METWHSFNGPTTHQMAVMHRDRTLEPPKETRGLRPKAESAARRLWLWWVVLTLLSDVPQPGQLASCSARMEPPKQPSMDCCPVELPAAFASLFHHPAANQHSCDGPAARDARISLTTRHACPTRRLQWLSLAPHRCMEAVTIASFPPGQFPPLTEASRAIAGPGPTDTRP